MKYSPVKPYNNLPDLPPKGKLETKAVFKKLISASRALSELKGAITNLPNPLLFIDTINLQEAQASSAIENIITTQDALFQASIVEKNIDDAPTKEVIHYKDALWYGLEEIRKRPVLTTNLFIAIMQIIKENQSGIRNIPGTQLKNPASSQVIYTPPDSEEVIRKKLAALENFINIDDDLDPLIKLALIHYQFEAIHPFFDGNGRTGRIILLLYLKQCGLLDLPALYLSSYILKNKNAYYLNLRHVTEKGNWENWILYMLDMIEVTSRESRSRIEHIAALMKEMGEEIQKALPKIYSKDLLEVLFRLPYTKRSSLEVAGLGNIKTAGNYLKSLEEKNFLQSVNVGKEKLYLNFRLMNLLKS
ncbi:Fic family protein [Dyadobacter jiangsuensis]|uniref:Fic family protein n=1 Tax=Dyadobacter jiangsuensis TaxID=1591085 RepID=A0A2P8G1J6_9BACT|nr:Fic family protein [Dyadobacter jiangsuensis]PSL27858.1 Fic family protein [Dyadobacter jiangsuensis]